MSLARKQAIISGIAWLVVSVAFIVIIAGIGVEAFVTPSGEKARTLLSWIILPGYLINFALIGWSQRGRRTGEIDERDQAVQARATGITAIVLLLAVFIFSIGIYEANAEEGTAPIGWFYILAYGSIALASLLHPVLTLVIDGTWKSNA